MLLLRAGDLNELEWKGEGQKGGIINSYYLHLSFLLG